MSKRAILVLLHERDGYPERRVHLLWPLVERWRSAGIEVRVAFGPNDPVAREDADLVFPHVDLSVTPLEYQAFLERRPNVVNPGVYDISKRAVSLNLVSADDGYEGPVIVKTDRNFGGLPESVSDPRRARRPLLQRAWNRLSSRRASDSEAPPLAEAETLQVGEYEVFDRKGLVPPSVFENANLVVERFIPEFDGRNYYIRMYQFLGDREYTLRLASPDPIVKGRTTESREEVEAHPDIVALREESGWDYGKWDYVVQDGRAVLLDTNRTPGRPSIPSVAATNADRLSSGVYSLLERSEART